MRCGINGEPLFQRVPSAVGIYLRALCRGLHEIDHAGEVVLFHSDHEAIPEGVERMGITRRAFGLSREALYDLWADARRPAPQSVCGPLDVVHAPGPAIPPSGGAPLVATVHDLAPLRFPDRYDRHKRVVQKRGAMLIAREAARIICPSQALAAELQELLGVEAARVRVVPHGVDVDAVEPAAARAKVAGWGIVEPYLLWVGTQEQRKNVQGVLEAFEQVAQTDARPTLVLHGFRGWLGEDVGERIDRPALRGRVVLSEHSLSRRDLSALYARARAFLYPSVYEGFGLPVLEAMACGTPVVTSNQSALPEAAGDAALLVDPFDTDALVGAIRRLLDDTGLHDDLARRGQQRAAGFTWAETARRTWAVYEEVVG